MGSGQTEAQAIAEAAKNRAQVQTIHGRRQSGPGNSSVSIPSLTETHIKSNLSSDRISSSSSSRPAPAGSGTGVGASTGSTSPRRNRSFRPLSLPKQPPSPQPPSLSSHASSTASSSSLINRTGPPGIRITDRDKSHQRGDKIWRPTGAAPAQVTVSPVTSVTTTIQATAAGSSSSTRTLLDENTPTLKNHAHFGLQPGVSSSPRLGGSKPFPRAQVSHSHSHSLSHSNNPRLRRSSISTIPDSPSSVSLSQMIAANAELSQNFSYIPGFPLNQDDTRSVRSLPFGNKKVGSVSKLIRRMRGEGLSKHYWMADEHCKECYDCKSVFSTWRRKHHCRICGQIFCTRCASNIIPARKFGQEGMLRVCNLCLKIMEDYKDDDEDDRRSIISVPTSIRLPNLSDRAFLESGISPEMTYAKSPFAASQLFTRHPNESLTAIDEGSAWKIGGDDGRPLTPIEDGYGSFEGEDDTAIYTGKPNPAPFRRPVDDEQNVDPNDSHDSQAPSSGSTGQPSPGEAGPKLTLSRLESRTGPLTSRIGFPRSETIDSDSADSRIPFGKLDVNAPLIGLRTRLSSRASQGGLTALLDSERNEGLWRARSHSFAKRPELLSGSSLDHFHLVLRQAIERAGLSHPKEWHAVLSPLLLKVSTSINPNLRTGDSIDARSYVKIKKVPGGKISDSEWVDGIVITKNVAHKAMPRRLVNPRIMLVTFPLDYHRVENQFMSLEPILTQEKDYLRGLTKRIIDVRPHIVLVERTASRLALDYLLEAGIAVARSVKNSAIHQVARCTQADVIASMDRLAIEPRLGRCAEFRIQSFEHDLIPGRRKTLMRFEGCHRDYGCTIVLRGGNTETLKKAKVVTDFLSLIVYHLKLEVFLYNDEHNILPPHTPLSPEYQELLHLLTLADPLPQSTDPETPTTPTPHGHDDERYLERLEALKTSKEIALSLQPYLTTALSASAAVRFPPPAPLARMAELDRRLTQLRVTRDEEEAAQILQEETRSELPRSATDSESASTVLTPASEIPDPLDSIISLSTAMSTLPIVAGGSSYAARDPYRVLRKPEEISKESALAQVKHQHEEQYKLWLWYTRRHTPALKPEDFQGIVYLYSLGCEGAEKPCLEPVIQHIDFYQPGDHTVGQFLEGLTGDAAKRCPKSTCDRLMLFHFRLLVHGNRRLQIAVDQFPCPSPGHEDKIITWSYCRLCATPSPTTILREETWKMSWGAYLEHCFYPPVVRAGFACPHDAYRDQIRYFAHRNLAIRIHNEQIDIYEPIRPSIALQIEAETKVVLKNREYESALQKNAAFFDSVLFRLRSIDYEIVHPEKVSLLRSNLEAMLSRAVADRDELVNLLNRTYKLTPMTDVLALNTVLRSLQDKVVQWDLDFADVEKAFMPSEKDLRRMTASHLKRLFANQDVFGSLDRNVAGLTVSEASEADEKEFKCVVVGDQTPDSSVPPTPDTCSETGVSTAPMEPVKKLMDSAETTPMAEIARSPLSYPPSSANDGSDSDSTISAPNKSPGKSLGSATRERPESSGIDSDAHGFISRLPRRSGPAPSIADLVKRFQESMSANAFTPVEEPDLERPHSSASARSARRRKAGDGSDSDQSEQSRPRLRRGRTEQMPSRTPKHRELSRLGLMSDGDRSYAANASRIPSTQERRDGLKVIGNHVRGPGAQIIRSTASGRASPDLSGRGGPNLTMSRPSFEAKPRVGGKGKMPRRSVTPSGRSSPTLARTVPRHSLAPTTGSRVSSIARHFDRLSREAEKDRAKRMSLARGKRARPVGVTKAKVQVFDNLRDAFKDEFDTDSSEADNEEDEDGSAESAESAGEGKPRRKSVSPTKTRQPSEPLDILVTSEDPPPDAECSTDVDTPSTSTHSVVSTSALTDANTDKSFTDRLQIELPPFDTSAPLPSVPATPLLSTDTGDEGRHAVSQLSQMSESEMSSGGERSSILKTLSGLWAFRAGEFSPLEYPLSASEHIFADSRVIIRETEPTSIIAFTISSKTYRDKMRNVAFQQKSGRKVETFMPDDASINGDRNSTWDVVSLDEAIETDDPMKREGGTHLKYDFESGASTIFCRIFFAEQFAALRSACQCEDSFVESLARCVQFDASGGKSGSAFLKTKDDRFIAKEISRLEMDALTKFAPAYFEYTRKGFTGQRPSVLAKIYGFFKIGYRNAITGRSMRMNVLIMENLFYERRFSKIYDLKGNTRNRLIQPTGRINEVLLDENLMEIAYKHPLYLREHSKRILRTALFNDTLFLSNLNVMDYSLVVGVDSEKQELVVGIVDYIRTFTWDKKLESWVKDSAFLGGAGRGEPTIVTPKQYKTRFRTAMEKFYFPSVPDRWTKVGAEEQIADEDASSAVS